MSEYEVRCPHRECGEVVFIAWDLAYTLSPTDLTEPVALIDSGDHHAGSWKVECAAGHVLLLPGSLGCPCPFEEQEGRNCSHDPDDYDHSDDYRAFRRHDVDRLRNVIALIGGDPE